MSTKEPVSKAQKIDVDKPAVNVNGDAKANGEVKPLAELKKLENFVFKEVLGSLPEKKTIFVHCHNTVEDKPAVLILDKVIDAVFNLAHISNNCNSVLTNIESITKHVHQRLIAVAFEEDRETLQSCIDGLDLIHISHNDVYGSFSVELPQKYNLLKSTFIYPATEKHINKYRFVPLHQVFETPEDYKKITLPFIESSQFSLSWVYNILDGNKEQDLLLYKDEDPQTGFHILRDLKWDGKTLEQLYYQVIVNRRDIKSVRDLTDKELPLLENILKTATKAIYDKHQIPASRLKIHFHYQPSYYHLHVHIRAMGTEADQPYVWLQSAIDNIKLMPDFYQKATLSCILKEGQPLYQRFKEANRL